MHAYELDRSHTRCPVCLQDGAVVEEGDHVALYADEASVYHALVKLQEQAMDQRAEANDNAAEMEPNEASDGDLLAAQGSAEGSHRTFRSGHTERDQSWHASSMQRSKQSGLLAQRGSQHADGLEVKQAQEHEEELVRSVQLCKS
jgi:hypothetical protein